LDEYEKCASREKSAIRQPAPTFSPSLLELVITATASSGFELSTPAKPLGAVKKSHFQLRSNIDGGQQGRHGNKGKTRKTGGCSFMKCL
jgi:hypothetical protein